MAKPEGEKPFDSASNAASKVSHLSRISIKSVEKVVPKQIEVEDIDDHINKTTDAFDSISVIAARNQAERDA